MASAPKYESAHLVCAVARSRAGLLPGDSYEFLCKEVDEVPCPDWQVLACGEHRVDAKLEGEFGHRLHQRAALDVGANQKVRLKDDTLVLERSRTTGVAAVGVDTWMGSAARLPPRRRSRQSGLAAAADRHPLDSLAVESLAVVGQREAPRRSMQQPHAQLREIRDMPRNGHRGLRGLLSCCRSSI